MFNIFVKIACFEETRTRPSLRKRVRSFFTGTVVRVSREMLWWSLGELRVARLLRMSCDSARLERGSGDSAALSRTFS